MSRENTCPHLFMSWSIDQRHQKLNLLPCSSTQHRTVEMAEHAPSLVAQDVGMSSLLDKLRAVDEFIRLRGDLYDVELVGMMRDAHAIEHDIHELESIVYSPMFMASVIKEKLYSSVNRLLEGTCVNRTYGSSISFTICRQVATCRLIQFTGCSTRVRICMDVSRVAGPI